MRGLGYFFKLKFYLGTTTAIKVYWDKCVKKGLLKVPFIKHPFKIRYGDFADDQIFNEVILKRSYHGLTAEDKVSRIIDLGSNIGLSVISFLSDYPKAEVVAVEPDVENFKILNENTKPYNDGANRIHNFNTAIYNREIELYIENPDVGSHGFRMVEGVIPRHRGSVKSITMNNLLVQLGWNVVDIIKIDIEGAEKELFETNTEWIGKTRFLIVETHDRFKMDSTKAVFRALEKYPYTMKVLNRNILFILGKEVGQ
jgi:FkbM family methyltransferase